MPTIPEYITVHLGEPEEYAPNIQVSFIDYIKNVAANEIYPTWPENALRANILAIISYALNRIYTEWYRSAGYNFDITSTTKFDQKYTPNHETYNTIDTIVDEIFNSYVVKEGKVNPFFTQYCDGRFTQCDGLSQTGTVGLAQEGLLPIQILRYYYGDDINIVSDAPVTQNATSYPGVPLKAGVIREEVRTLQRELNRIAENYPSIGIIPETNGFFGTNTETAVKNFQKIFNLPANGIVDEVTWYKIKYIYNNVKKLSELYSEGITLEEINPAFRQELKLGDSGTDVRVAQYYLNLIGFFDENIPITPINGYFGEDLRDTVFTFQSEYGLPITGKIDQRTFNLITKKYNNLIKDLPQEYISLSESIFPGRPLSLGMTGSDIETLQKLLAAISIKDPSIPSVQVTGIFDNDTFNAVQEIQRRYNLPEDEIVTPLIWSEIVQLYNSQ